LTKAIMHPEAIVTDKLGSYGAAAREMGLSDRHQPGGLAENNRAELCQERVL
jgi:transposase-like protein